MCRGETSPPSTDREAGSTTYSAVGSGTAPGTDTKGTIVWDLNVDSTVCRAHQHAAGARKQGDLQKEPPGGIFVEPGDHALGRSRGGFTTTLHLTVEQVQKPMSIVLTAGQRGDSPQFEPVLEKVRVPRIGPGRPRVRPNRVRADKAYGSRKNRAYLRRRGIRCTIPDKACLLYT